MKNPKSNTKPEYTKTNHSDDKYRNTDQRNMHLYLMQQKFVPAHDYTTSAE